MSLLVVGSIAIDSVCTPKGETDEALGGSAVYFAHAASHFSSVRVVGVIGDDFPADQMALLEQHPKIDTAGIVRQAGKTFRWKGRYAGAMNAAETLEVHLNVFADFDPDLPDDYRDSKFVFLANGSPVTQRRVLHQIRDPKLVVADTMNLWIETQRDELLALLGQVDGLILNDQEALLLTEEDQLVLAGAKILQMGPKFVIVKKGEHGAMYFGAGGPVAIPAFPTPDLVDPTGAGDSFAGGFMGYLSSADSTDLATMKRGMVFGAVTASVNVEDFSLNRLRSVTGEELHHRFEQYREMLRIA